MQPRLDTMSGSRAKQATPAGSGAVAASNREVEDLALEDLREAINQVVFLQNVRATLMDEIKSLKTHAAEQDDALKRALAAAQVCHCPILTALAVVYGPDCMRESQHSRRQAQKTSSAEFFLAQKLLQMADGWVVY